MPIVHAKFDTPGAARFRAFFPMAFLQNQRGPLNGVIDARTGFDRVAANTPKRRRSSPHVDGGFRTINAESAMTEKGTQKSYTSFLIVVVINPRMSGIAAFGIQNY
jgi:hypothetical protein